MSDEPVEVHTTADDMQAEMLAELLAAEGISVELVGPRNAALLGAAAHIVPVSLRVAPSQAEDARELIASVLGGAAPPGSDADASAARRDASGSTGSALPSATRPPRRRVVAVGAALIVPGGSHYYAGRPWAGLVLTVSFAAALVMLARGSGTHAEVSAGAVTLAALVLLDLLGGLQAVRAAARRRAAPSVSRARQLAAGVALAALSFVTGAVVGPRLPPPQPRPSDADLELLRLWQEQEQTRRGRGTDETGTGGGGRLTW